MGLYWITTTTSQSGPSSTAVGFYQARGHASTTWHLQLSSWVGGRLIIFGHFTANVVWVPSTFIHYWWENKCLCGILDAAITLKWITTSTAYDGVFFCFVTWLVIHVGNVSPGKLAFLTVKKRSSCNHYAVRAVVACCHGNYLLIFQHSFLTDKEGERHFLTAEKKNRLDIPAETKKYIYLYREREGAEPCGRQGMLQYLLHTFGSSPPQRDLIDLDFVVH